MTSSTHDGNLGGLAGADQVCQSQADNAGLPGTYKAWLSDASTSPADRFVHHDGPYVQPGASQIVIATSWIDLTDDTLANPINRFADGTETGSLGYWTNTATDGTIYDTSATCSSWMSNVTGFPGAISGVTEWMDSKWTEGTGGECNQPQHLLCFQQ